MSRSSSPWATPSSSAGRRLLQAEPPTLDDFSVPVPLLVLVSVPTSPVPTDPAHPTNEPSAGAPGRGTAEGDVRGRPLGPRPLALRPSAAAARPGPAPPGPVVPSVPIDREELAVSRPWPRRRPTPVPPSLRPSAPGAAIAPSASRSPRRCPAQPVPAPSAADVPISLAPGSPRHRTRAVTGVVVVAVLALGVIVTAPSARPARSSAAPVSAAPSPARVEVVPLGLDLGRATVALGAATHSGAGGPGAVLTRLVQPDVVVARATLVGERPSAALRLGRLLASARAG